MKCIIVHYSEIGTKGGNRRFFEKRLVENIKLAVDCKVERKRGRIVLRKVKAKDVNKLVKIPGISHFSIAEEAKKDMKRIGVVALKIAKKSKAKTLRVTASRADKSFKHTSPEIHRMIGGAVW
ncbi:MAG: tRNA 4-thiouridine(8) synthase ThiI, partial [Candidatus Aenigmarchaeota archaeon]|nr:tRNA 4-thiouridine(8) synthase ThiI [Candidatus Aenigmarchaeota archaeon]